METRILCLIESFMDIGLLHSLQEKYNCKLYALIDTNKYMKKFFQEQQLVKFEKVWYHRDYVIKSKDKPDLKYLSLFEKKYKINLWQIAYMDRNLYFYNPYYKFKSDEILLVFEKICKLFEKILDEVNPNFAIIKPPDYHQSELLFELCKSRGIHILTLSPTRYGSRSFISEQTGIIDNFDEIIRNYRNDDQEGIKKLQNYLNDLSEQVSVVIKELRGSMWKKFKASFKFLLVVCNDEYRQYCINFGRTRLKILINETSLFLKKLYRKSFIDKNFKRRIDPDVSFVYFPLHFQPERSTLMDSPFYENQLEIISKIARSLPIEYRLYVKEHPAQVSNGWRSISYYKSILELPNVILIHPSVQNQEILSKCSLVITITGTLGLEAALHNKPSIVFADVDYSYISSVYRVKSYEDLPEVIRSTLDKKVVDLSSLSKFINCITENSFDYPYIKLEAEVQNRFFNGGFYFDIEVPTDSVVSFLKENKSTFDILSSEYIKKINEDISEK